MGSGEKEIFQSIPGSATGGGWNFREEAKARWVSDDAAWRRWPEEEVSENTKRSKQREGRGKEEPEGKTHLQGLSRGLKAVMPAG